MICHQLALMKAREDIRGLIEFYHMEGEAVSAQCNSNKVKLKKKKWKLEVTPKHNYFFLKFRTHEYMYTSEAPIYEDMDCSVCYISLHMPERKQ